VANILYLVHRMPYPPNKGDKVRSYHLLRHLTQRHRVHLGTFIDDPADEKHVDTLRGLCEQAFVATLHPIRARLASLRGLLTNEPLTLPYYRDAGLLKWVRDTAAQVPVDAVVVFSSSMAQYAAAVPGVPVLVDFVDVDSAKWTDYAPQHRWPLSWLYRREGRRLLACERAVSAQARHGFFATEKETQLFVDRAPEAAGRVSAMNNGVDANYFSPSADRASPFPAGDLPVVFTGAMDYWPNVDAVTWFAREALPVLRRQWPGLRFFIVGRAPTAAVQALAGEGVVVTGTVADVRPYLQHAAVVVAPLRLARGIQNKVLEAMAMGRPVVAAQGCVEALHAEPGVDVISAATSNDFAAAVHELLSSPEKAARVGEAGRVRVLTHYGWAAHMAVLERHIQALQPRATPALAQVLQ
jgi:sugar transferase (PEP-CTERM/EpsH1 system associated)